MFFRRRGNQLLAGLRQFNMISLRWTPGQFAVAQDGWLRPDSEKNKTCAQEMLQEGQIEPSFAVVLVTKKDGTTRFCVDYRRLNALMTKDAYYLPRIDDSLRLLGNQQWFSTMDLISGYRQVPCRRRLSARSINVPSCRRKWFSWDILWAA